MAKRILIIVLVLAVLAGAAYALMSRSSNNETATMTETTSSEDMTNMDMTEQSPQQSQVTENNANAAVATSSIEIKDYGYSPATVTVKKGTKVTWTNQDGVRHDVAPDSDTDEFKKSDLLAKGESYSVTFNTVGTYTYYCSPHPYMKGTVIVTE